MKQYISAASGPYYYHHQKQDLSPYANTAIDHPDLLGLLSIAMKLSVKQSLADCTNPQTFYKKQSWIRTEGTMGKSHLCVY